MKTTFVASAGIESAHVAYIPMPRSCIRKQATELPTLQNWRLQMAQYPSNGWGDQRGHCNRHTANTVEMQWDRNHCGTRTKLVNRPSWMACRELDWSCVSSPRIEWSFGDIVAKISRLFTETSRCSHIVIETQFEPRIIGQSRATRLSQSSIAFKFLWLVALSLYSPEAKRFRVRNRRIQPVFGVWKSLFELFRTQIGTRRNKRAMCLTWCYSISLGNEIDSMIMKLLSGLGLIFSDCNDLESNLRDMCRGSGVSIGVFSANWT